MADVRCEPPRRSGPELKFRAQLFTVSRHGILQGKTATPWLAALLEHKAGVRFIPAHKTRLLRICTSIKQRRTIQRFGELDNMLTAAWRLADVMMMADAHALKLDRQRRLSTHKSHNCCSAQRTALRACSYRPSPVPTPSLRNIDTRKQAW